MRILYLIYDQKNSVTDFNDNLKTKLPWVDALLGELIKCNDITIALAAPVKNKSYQKSQKSGITIFGLPNPEEKNILKKIYKRLTHASENGRINSYVEQVIKDFEPDIIQIFGSENPFGLISAKSGCPIVIHIQGSLLVVLKKWFTGVSKWEQFRFSGIKDLLLMRGNYDGFFSFRKRAEREVVIMQNCKYFIGRTNFDKRIVSLLSPGSAYFHCEEFIRKDFFEKQWDFPLRNQEVICVSILKGTTYKGIDLLVEALLILKKHSTLSYKFKICGISADEEIVRIIKRKYRKEINFSDVEFLGRLTACELVSQLCNSNFYIHPSYVENSPNSICEAMALGMPIIATNVGGVSSLIEDEAEGVLVQEGEPYSLSGALVDLVNNYEKARLLGYNARARAFKRHNPSDILKNLLDIYNTIVYDDRGK